MINIESLIRQHVEKLSNVTIAYQYSEMYDMHLIEVIPYSRLEDDIVFDAVHDVIDEYVAEYPTESWYIINPNSKVKIMGVPFVFSRQAGRAKQSTFINMYGLTNAKPQTERVILFKEFIKPGLRGSKSSLSDPVTEKFSDNEEFYAFAA